MEVSPEYKTIVETAVARRHELGWSQKQLAAQCGVSPTIIGRMEAFTNIPSIEAVLKMIEPLGLTLIIIEK